MKKKLFSALLSFALALSLLPTAARATGSAQQEYDLASGSITVSVDTDGKQYVTQENGVTNEKQTEETVIKQTNATATTNTITITAETGQTARVTLSGVNIETMHSAISTNGDGNVIIELDGNNTVTGGAGGYANAGVEKANAGTLTISDANNNGRLTAKGGKTGAGIGRSGNYACTNITITGGTIIATGGYSGAGIGGGVGANVSNIRITGGTVTATGGENGAGIGSADTGEVSGIYISNAVVTATGGKFAAGIGGGRGVGTDISITNSTVIAKGGDYGAGIGCGGDTSPNKQPMNKAIKVTVTDSTITAIGGIAAAGIGGSVEPDSVEPDYSSMYGGGQHYEYMRGAIEVTVSGSSEVCVQGGAGDNSFGNGAGIGRGGSNTDNEPTKGEEVNPIISGLTAGGFIKYYAPGADIKTAAPIGTVPKTTPTLTFAGTVYSNVGTTSFNYSYDGDGTVRASSSNKNVATVSVDADTKTVIVDVIRAGTATITVSADSGANSAAAAGLTYVLTVKEYVAPSYIGAGDSSPSRYAVSVDEAEHGSVSVSAKKASSGTQVTLTVKPDKGYTLETLTATDARGNALTLKAVKIGETYSFTMPATAVTVLATFMEDNTMLNYFIDVNARDYFYDAVLWAVEKGVTDGTDALHFSPNDPCTRAQIVTFLWRAAGSPEPKSASSFSDVAAGSYYAKAVAWAVEQGITGGTGNGEFSPDATCTRAQAVTFLYRAAGSPAVSGDAEFSDVPATAYYANAVKWAENENVTTGIGGELFGSNNDCTRGQIVTFLWRTTIE